MSDTLNIENLHYENLSLDEKKGVSNNGFGAECARYIKITYDGKTQLLESDAMEPEDAVFYRSLSWIVPALKMCYELGKRDGAKK